MRWRNTRSNKINPDTLLTKLKRRGIKPPLFTSALIKEKLSADEDGIATESLHVSLICPLSKMRMTIPCRPNTCRHVQCFDAGYFLQMNELKPTWKCAVCNAPSTFESLIIDGLFTEILKSAPSDASNIVFDENAQWKIADKKKKEKPPTDVQTIEDLGEDEEEPDVYTVSAPKQNAGESSVILIEEENESSPDGGKKSPAHCLNKSADDIPVIELLDSDSEDDEDSAEIILSSDSEAELAKVRELSNPVQTILDNGYPQWPMGLGSFQDFHTYHRPPSNDSELWRVIDANETDPLKIKIANMRDPAKRNSTDSIPSPPRKRARDRAGQEGQPSHKSPDESTKDKHQKKTTKDFKHRKRDRSKTKRKSDSQKTVDGLTDPFNILQPPSCQSLHIPSVYSLFQTSHSLATLFPPSLGIPSPFSNIPGYSHASPLYTPTSTYTPSSVNSAPLSPTYATMLDVNSTLSNAAHSVNTSADSHLPSAKRPTNCQMYNPTSPTHSSTSTTISPTCSSSHSNASPVPARYKPRVLDTSSDSSSDEDFYESSSSSSSWCPSPKRKRTPVRKQKKPSPSSKESVSQLQKRQSSTKNDQLTSNESQSESKSGHSRSTRRSSPKDDQDNNKGRSEQDTNATKSNPGSKSNTKLPNASRHKSSNKSKSSDSSQSKSSSKSKSSDSSRHKSSSKSRSSDSSQHKSSSKSKSSHSLQHKSSSRTATSKDTNSGSNRSRSSTHHSKSTSRSTTGRKDNEQRVLHESSTKKPLSPRLEKARARFNEQLHEILESHVNPNETTTTNFSTLSNQSSSSESAPIYDASKNLFIIPDRQKPPQSELAQGQTASSGSVIDMSQYKAPQLSCSSDSSTPIPSPCHASPPPISPQSSSGASTPLPSMMGSQTPMPNSFSPSPPLLQPSVQSPQLSETSSESPMPRNFQKFPPYVPQTSDGKVDQGNMSTEVDSSLDTSNSQNVPLRIASPKIRAHTDESRKMSADSTSDESSSRSLNAPSVSTTGCPSNHSQQPQVNEHRISSDTFDPILPSIRGSPLPFLQHLANVERARSVGGNQAVFPTSSSGYTGTSRSHPLQASTQSTDDVETD